MFIVNLVSIAKHWKQLKYPSKENGFLKVWHIYTNRIIPSFDACNDMDESQDYFDELQKPDTKKNVLYMKF